MESLTGSEKQVKWAEEIRAKYLATVERTADKIAAGQVTWIMRSVAVQVKAAEILRAQAAEDQTHLEAKWWIDHRRIADLATSKFLANLLAEHDAELKAALAAERSK